MGRESVKKPVGRPTTAKGKKKQNEKKKQNVAKKKSSCNTLESVRSGKEWGGLDCRNRIREGAHRTSWKKREKRRGVHYRCTARAAFKATSRSSSHVTAAAVHSFILQNWRSNKGQSDADDSLFSYSNKTTFSAMAVMMITIPSNIKFTRYPQRRHYTVNPKERFLSQFSQHLLSTACVSLKGPHEIQEQSEFWPLARLPETERATCQLISPKRIGFLCQFWLPTYQQPCNACVPDDLDKISSSRLKKHQINNELSGVLSSAQ